MQGRIGVFEDMDHIYIVQELIEGSNLFDFSTKLKFNERCAQVIMKDLASGLRYLAQSGVAHRDIKLENIMVT